MARVYVKPYSDLEITGADFDPVTTQSMRRILFSPDANHSISMNSLADGCLGFSNNAKAPFSFTVSRSHGKPLFGCRALPRQFVSIRG